MWKLIFLRGCVQSSSWHLLKRSILPLPLPSGVAYRHLCSTHALHFLLPITSITLFRALLPCAFLKCDPLCACLFSERCIYFILCVWVFGLCVCLCILYVPMEVRRELRIL